MPAQTSRVSRARQAQYCLPRAQCCAPRTRASTASAPKEPVRETREAARQIINAVAAQPRPAQRGLPRRAGDAVLVRGARRGKRSRRRRAQCAGGAARREYERRATHQRAIVERARARAGRTAARARRDCCTERDARASAQESPARQATCVRAAPAGRPRGSSVAAARRARARKASASAHLLRGAANTLVAVVQGSSSVVWRRRQTAAADPPKKKLSSPESHPALTRRGPAASLARKKWPRSPRPYH